MIRRSILLLRLLLVRLRSVISVYATAIEYKHQHSLVRHWDTNHTALMHPQLEAGVTECRTWSSHTVY